MDRYLLFDSGCVLCTELAQNIEAESDGWLEARSLRNSEMQLLIQKTQPDWEWQPTLVEVEDDEATVTTGIALMAKIVTGLGVQRAWRIIKLISEANPDTRGVSQERRQFLRHSGALLASLPLLGMPSFRNNLLLTDISNLDWQTYKDPDLDFTLQYPVGYQIETKHKQPQSLVNEEAILKRVVFASSPALIYLDIWLAKGKNLSDWLTWYKETRQVSQMPTEANAEVATKTAVTFLQEQQRNLMITYLTDGEYVYRLLNWITSNPADLDVYWHILDTFTLSSKKSLAKAELPLVVKQKARKSVSWVGDPKAFIANCCGYYDYGNPFPCCTQGNCTWWVYKSMGYVPFTGNASTWWGDALNYQDWGHYSQPSTSVDSIGCWKIDQDRDFGHVAYAASYSGSGQVTVTHMHCNTAGRNCKSTDPINTTAPTQGWLVPLY